MQMIMQLAPCRILSTPFSTCRATLTLIPNHVEVIDCYRTNQMVTEAGILLQQIAGAPRLHATAW